MGDSLLVRPVADEIGMAHSGGVDIAWRRYGDGDETILFIPTWNFVDSRVLGHQVDGLRDSFRLITYDARGSGDSQRPPRGYRFEDHVADAIAVLAATNTPIASVVAASLGTHVAVLLAAQYPALVRRLVMVAPPMDVPGKSARHSADAAGDAESGPSDPAPNWRTDYRPFVRWFISTVFPEPGAERTIKEVIAIADEADHAMLIQQGNELDWDAAPRKLHEVRCPSLVVHGTDDRIIDVNSVEPVAAAIPGAKLVLLDDLGHRPDISRPDIVNLIFRDFIGATR